MLIKKFLIVLFFIVFIFFGKEKLNKIKKNNTKKYFTLGGNFFIFTDFFLKSSSSNKTNFHFLGNWDISLLIEKNAAFNMSFLGEQQSIPKDKLSLFYNHIIKAEEFNFNYYKKDWEFIIGRFNLPYTIKRLKIKTIFKDKTFHSYKITEQQGIGIVKKLDEEKKIDFRIFSHHKKDTLSILKEDEDISSSLIFSYKNKDDTFHSKLAGIITRSKDNLSFSEKRVSFSFDFFQKINEIERVSYILEVIGIKKKPSILESFINFGLSYSIKDFSLTLLGILSRENSTSKWKTEFSIGERKSEQEYIGLGILFSNDEAFKRIIRFSYVYFF